MAGPRLVDSRLTGAVTAGGKPAVLVAAAARRRGSVLARDGRLLLGLRHRLALGLRGQRRILHRTIRHLVGGGDGACDLRVGGHVEPVLVLVAVGLLLRLGGDGRRLVAEHAVLVGLAEGAGEALQRVAELRRHHPHGVAVLVGQLRQLLQVLPCQQLRRQLRRLHRGIDLLDRARLALRLQVTGRAVTFGAQDGGLPLALGGEDGRVLVALGGENLRLLAALGGLDVRLAGALRGEDHRALLAVGLHLLFHRLLDRRRRLDGLQLDAGDAQAPLRGGLVQLPAQAAVDVVAGGQGLLQRQAADHVAQRGGGDLLDAEDVVGHAVDGARRVVDLERHHGVDGHGQVVLGDHGLRREGDHPFTGVHLLAHTVDERDDERQASGQGPGVPAEPFDDCCLALGDEDDRLAHQHQNEQDEYCGENESRHGLTPPYPRRPCCRRCSRP